MTGLIVKSGLKSQRSPCSGTRDIPKTAAQLPRASDIRFGTLQPELVQGDACQNLVASVAEMDPGPWASGFGGLGFELWAVASQALNPKP